MPLLWPPAVEARATFHLLLGRVLLDRGELNEALSHATLGRQLVRAHWTALRAGMGLQLSQLWDLGGDVLEKMGRLQEAREWDHDAEHLVGTIINSARRRALQELVRKGDHEVRTSNPMLRLASTRDASYIHKGLGAHAYYTFTRWLTGCTEAMRRTSAQPWMPLKLFARSLTQKAERRAREGVRVIQATREASMLPSDEQNTVLEAFAGTLHLYSHS